MRVLGELWVPGLFWVTNDLLEAKFRDAIYTKTARENGWLITWPRDGYARRVQEIHARVRSALVSDGSDFAAMWQRGCGIGVTLNVGSDRRVDSDAWALPGKAAVDALAQAGVFGVTGDNAIVFTVGRVARGQVPGMWLRILERGVDDAF
jgi:hypothetical protein